MCISEDITAQVSYRPHLDCTRMCATDNTCIAFASNPVAKGCLIYKKKDSLSSSHAIAITSTNDDASPYACYKKDTGKNRQISCHIIC